MNIQSICKGLLILLSCFFSSCYTLESDALRFDKISRDLYTDDHVTYALPSVLIKVVLDQKVKDGVAELTLGVSEHFTGDPSHLYTLNLKHSPMAKDEFDIQVEAGTQLIDKIVNKHTDQTGAVIVKTAELGAGLTRFLSGLAPSTKIAPDTNRGPEPFRVEKIIESERAIECDGILIYKSAASGSFYLNLRPLSGVGYPEASSYPSSESLSDFGVYYRIALPYIAEIIRKKDGKSDTIHTKLVSVPDLSPIQFLNLKRRAFVKVEYSIDFTNGMPTVIDSTQPSEILAFMKTPILVLDRLSSALPLQIRIDQAGQNHQYYEAQKAAIEAQIEILKNQRTLDELQTQSQTGD